MNTLPEIKTENQGPKKTRGEAYVAEFLSDHDFLDMDAEWIAESINNGSIAPNAADELAKHSAYAGTPGLQYIAQWLAPNCGDFLDACHICECINDRRVIVCDQCHFVHLNLESAGCDVCAQLPAALRFQDSVDDILDQLILDGPADLIEARTDRATAISHLLLSGYDCAAALLWGAMGEAIIPLRPKDSPEPKREGKGDDGGGANLRMAA